MKSVFMLIGNFVRSEFVRTMFATYFLYMAVTLPVELWYLRLLFCYGAVDFIILILQSYVDKTCKTNDSCCLHEHSVVVEGGEEEQSV